MKIIRKSLSLEKSKKAKIDYNVVMIEVTRLNGTLFFVNPDMIVTIEATPDTIISLNNGEKLVVKNSLDNITRQFLDYKKQIMSGGLKVKTYTPPEEVY